MSNNKFIFFDRSLWIHFISKLLYPAILGSLIYDFTKFEPNREYWLLFVTLVFYVIDYFYMHYTYKKCINSGKEDKKIGFLKLCDFLVALAFILIIYSIHNSNYLFISYSTLFIFLITLIYDLSDKCSNTIIGILFTSTTIIVFVQQLFFNCSCCSESGFNAWTYTFIIFLYAVAVSIDYYFDNLNKLDLNKQ